MICLNGKNVHIIKFPNGESLIKTEDLNIVQGVNELKVKFQEDKDILYLMFIKKHLDEKGSRCKLVIPYMPYSRMDRTEGVTVFTLKYLCNIINSLNFEEVRVYEPHSEVTLALLDRVVSVDMTKILAMELLDRMKDENVYLVYPDQGAAKRYGKQISYDKILTCSKERDFKTGYIKSLKIYGDIEEEGFTAIIVDDLCSRGGTFMLTGSELRKLGAKKVYLVVTHCEDTIADGDLLKTDIIDEIITTDSILSIENEKIKINRI